MDSYGGSLRYKVRYEVARGMLEPVQRPDVVLVGAGYRLLSRGHTPTHPGALNQRQVLFSEVGGAGALRGGEKDVQCGQVLTHDTPPRHLCLHPGALGS